MHPGPQPLTAAQTSISVGEQGLHQQPLGLGIDLGIDGIHLAGRQHLAAPRSAQEHGLAKRQSITKHRRHLNTGLQSVVLDKTGEGLVLLNDVAHLHLHISDGPGGGGAQIAVAQGGFQGFHLLSSSDVTRAVGVALTQR